MLTRFRKYFIEQKILFLLVFFYFVTRLYHLLILPIFTDESIYLYWAKLIETTRSQWFISLYDGKPPLLILLIVAMLMLFPTADVLLLGRLVSVFVGAVSLLGIYHLTYLLFSSRKMAIIAGILYILSPFHLMYDRMVLFDSLLTATLIWSSYFAVRAGQTVALKHSLLWGVSLGLGFLSKPPAILFALLTPLVFLLYAVTPSKKLPWKKLVSGVGVATVVSQLLNNVQRISGSYVQMAIKNQQFQQPIQELLRDPFKLTASNLQQFSTWIEAYYTIPLVIVGLLGLLLILRRQFREGATLVILWFIPLVILSTVGRQIYPRYIVFVTPYFIIAVAYFFSEVIHVFKYKAMTAAFFVFLLFSQLKLDWYILTDPPKAALPTSDYTQYISEHPSGYGLETIFSFLDKEAKKGKITIVTQGTFGLYPYAFQLRYWNNPNVKIVARWPLNIIDQEIYDMQKTSTVYIVLKEHEYVPGHLLQKLVVKGEKPGGKFPILLTTFL